MKNQIKLLPKKIANQIAAGEVVQRPASVVKELIENAVDAGATKIILNLKEAGKTLIQIIDNGMGMHEKDAALCFERHATSKIKKATDLFKLTTKGFRGEALASIAAIAHVSLKTKPHLQELGTHITIQGGEITTNTPCTCPSGSIIEVKHLFFNVPARRNFLKSNTVELRHIIDEFQRVALVHENIHFQLSHNGNELFHLPATNKKKRISGIFGTKISEKIIPITEQTEMVKITGYIGKPNFAKKNRGEQFFFVNQRYIKNAYLNHAIQSAYEGLLKDKSHPSYFLYLELDPKSIDVNIHPTKTEIKFDNDASIYAILRATIKHSMGQFQIMPTLDFDRDASLDLPYEYTRIQKSDTPKIEVNQNFNPFAMEQERYEKSSNSSKNDFNKAPKYIPKKNNDAPWEALYSGLNTSENNLSGNFETTNSTPNVMTFASKANRKEEEQGVKKEEESFVIPSKMEIEDKEDVESLFSKNMEAFTSFKVFQLHKKYIVTKTTSGLIIIHQKRASYRIAYELLEAKIQQQTPSPEPLLFPLALEFSPNEITILKELSTTLKQIGIILNFDKDNTLQVEGLPALLKEKDVMPLLQELIESENLQLPKEHSGINSIEILIKSVAKATSLKTGEALNDSLQTKLVNNLFACKNPQSCPEGKPVFITFDQTQIDQKF